jgi:outer membrane receptor for ferrienterochelin and colicin
VSEQLSLAMGVENLFDKSFDLIGSNQEQANTYPTVYDVFGRSYFASASFKF